MEKVGSLDLHTAYVLVRYIFRGGNSYNFYVLVRYAYKLKNTLRPLVFIVWEKVYEVNKTKAN